MRGGPPGDDVAGAAVVALARHLGEQPVDEALLDLHLRLQQRHQRVLAQVQPVRPRPEHRLRHARLAREAAVGRRAGRALPLGVVVEAGQAGEDP